VHEEVKIFFLGICKLLLKPSQSRLTVPALVMPGLVGVQIEKRPTGRSSTDWIKPFSSHG